MMEIIVKISADNDDEDDLKHNVGGDYDTFIQMIRISELGDHPRSKAWHGHDARF